MSSGDKSHEQQDKKQGQGNRQHQGTGTQHGQQEDKHGYGGQAGQPQHGGQREGEGRKQASR
jgi:hypothetical protein